MRVECASSDDNAFGQAKAFCPFLGERPGGNIGGKCIGEEACAQTGEQRVELS